MQKLVAAKNLLDKIEREIEVRANSSAQYEKYKSSKNRKMIYYRIYVNNYTIFYTIKDKTKANISGVDFKIYQLACKSLYILMLQRFAF